MSSISRNTISEQSIAAGDVEISILPGEEIEPSRGRWRKLNDLGRRNLPLLVWLLLCLIWGSTWMFIKLGLQDLPPFTFAGIRFVIAGLIVGAIVAWRRRPLPRTRREWLLIGVTGVLSFTINYGLVFWGEHRTSSALPAVLQTIIPVFGLIIAHFYLPEERITVPKIFGVMMGIAGVAVIFSNQIAYESRSALWGSIAIVVGAFAVAYANVLVKKYGGGIDSATLTLGQMICGIVPLLTIGVTTEINPFEIRWTPLALLSLGYLAIVGTAVAFLLYYWLVRNIKVTNTMLIPLVTPLIAVTLGMLVLDERLTWRIVVGSLGIMSGIGLIVTRRMKHE